MRQGSRALWGEQGGEEMSRKKKRRYFLVKTAICDATGEACDGFVNMPINIPCILDCLGCPLNTKEGVEVEQ